MVLIKKHVVKGMMDRTGLDEGTCRHALNALLATILEGCKCHGEVRLNGFGVFRTRLHAGRVINHPQSGEAIKVAPKLKMQFSPTRHFNEV